MVGEPEILEENLSFALYAAAHIFVRRYGELLAQLDLTYTQYLVMLVLWEGDRITVKAVGRRLLLDSGTLTPLLKRLEANGWITRRRDEEDERQVRLTLTTAGDHLKQRAAAIPRQVDHATGLNDATRARLRATLAAARSALMSERLT